MAHKFNQKERFGLHKDWMKWPTDYKAQDVVRSKVR